MPPKPLLPFAPWIASGPWSTSFLHDFPHPARFPSAVLLCSFVSCCAASPTFFLLCCFAHVFLAVLSCSMLLSDLPLGCCSLTLQPVSCWSQWCLCTHAYADARLACHPLRSFHLPLALPNLSHVLVLPERLLGCASSRYLLFTK